MARLDEFKQYDTVRIVRILHPNNSMTAPSKREPVSGDIATIVEVYTNPPGFELECSDPASGETLWLESFSVDQLDVERFLCQ